MNVLTTEIFLTQVLCDFGIAEICTKTFQNRKSGPALKLTTYSEDRECIKVFSYLYNLLKETKQIEFDPLGLHNSNDQEDDINVEPPECETVLDEVSTEDEDYCDDVTELEENE